MYAASTESSVVAVSGFGSLVHPGEDASAKEEDDWWRAAEAIVAGTDAAYFSVNLPPPRLKHLHAEGGDHVDALMPRHGTRRV